MAGAQGAYAVAIAVLCHHVSLGAKCILGARYILAAYTGNACIMAQCSNSGNMALGGWANHMSKLLLLILRCVHLKLYIYHAFPSG